MLYVGIIIGMALMCLFIGLLVLVHMFFQDVTKTYRTWRAARLRSYKVNWKTA